MVKLKAWQLNSALWSPVLSTSYALAIAIYANLKRIGNVIDCTHDVEYELFLITPHCYLPTAIHQSIPSPVSLPIVVLNLVKVSPEIAKLV